MFFWKKSIKSNIYPGIGIIIGKTQDSSKIIQIYWIMGRSENSRNRIFKIDRNNFVKTEPFDLKKLKDPSLIIYYPVKQIGHYHIVSNGDQTETIFNFSQNNRFTGRSCWNKNQKPKYIIYGIRTTVAQ